MSQIISFIAVLAILFSGSTKNYVTEVQLKDGQVFIFDKVGRESLKGGLIKTLRVSVKDEFSYHLHYDKIKEITFGKISENTTTAEVTFSNEKYKNFEILNDNLICIKEDKTVLLSLSEIKKISFSNF